MGLKGHLQTFNNELFYQVVTQADGEKQKKAVALSKEKKSSKYILVLHH